jgi:hypothetical protein
LLLALFHEGHSKNPQKLVSLVVGFGGGDDGYIHAAGLIRFGEINFGKYELIPKSERVISPSVEGL